MKKVPLFQKLKYDYPGIDEKELYAMILCGEVLAENQVLKDPKVPVPGDSLLELNTKKYVSRGGYKLEKALKLWDAPVKGRILLDAGSSTGGFTDCLLQNGASSVYAVDVGYNQLDYSLRTNPAVVVMEKTNIMHVETLAPAPHWAVADLSFRSIRSAASHIINLTSEKFLIALVKPQFEWKNPDESFSGVVSSSEKIIEIAEAVIDELVTESAYVLKAVASPVSGRKGNRELLFWISSDLQQTYPDKADLIESLQADLKKY
ncbi:MAG: hypothetical protein B6241_01365 [Spirochaetaceae bacterium 4572_59]|nr:MAG: hypothetical protein B6241_01365 [Spirochaetaceae bacterium 4572_59]